MTGNLVALQSYFPEIPIDSLHLAAQLGQKEILLFLLKKGANIDGEQAVVGAYSPLHLALKNQQLECAVILLKAGARVDGRSAEGSSALHYAVQTGKEEVVQAILERSPDLKLVDARGNTPSDLARALGYDKIKGLIEDKADPPWTAEEQEVLRSCHEVTKWDGALLPRPLPKVDKRE